MNRTVVVIQGRVPHYRVGLFSELQECEGIDLLVCHSGSPVGDRHGFRERVLKSIKVGPFVWQRGLIGALREADSIVAMFDLRWLGTVVAWALYRRKTNFWWWGIGCGRSRFANGCRRFLARRSAGVILYSKQGGGFAQYGPKEVNIVIAPNSVTTPAVKEAVEGDVRRSFVFLGALESRKGFEELLEAFSSALGRLSTDCDLTIIGSGPEGNSWKLLVKEKGLSGRISFEGQCTDDEALNQMVGPALAVVLPKQAGLSILHSFAFGTPVIAGRCAISGGELENIITGYNGVLYDSREDLVEILLYLDRNRDEAARMGENARRHYEQFRGSSPMVGAFERALSKGARES